MKRMLWSFIICAFASVSIVGCATYPASTGFVAKQSDSDDGYQVKPLAENISLASYQGNRATSSLSAFAYTMLAGYEHCAKDHRVAYVTTPLDSTKKETYTQVGSYTLPVYNSNGTTSYTTSVYSYPVTNTYPEFSSIVHCRKKYQTLDQITEVENIGRELVHNVTKDFRGGVLVKAVRELESGNPFIENDVVIRVGNKRVESEEAIYSALESVNSPTITVEIIRDQKLTKVAALLTNFTASIQELQEKMIPALCEYVPLTEEVNQLGERRDVPAPQICGTQPAAKVSRQ